jgi:peptide/nickel transport system substrate-binding protein
MLQRAGWAGVGLAGALAFACKSGSTPTTSSGPATRAQGGAGTVPAGAPQGVAPSVASLLSRTGKPAGAGEQPQPGGVFRALFNANPATLDPHGTSNVYTGQVAGAVASRLMRIKTTWDVATSLNAEVEPDLAQSVESPELTTWIFKLRRDARFQNVPPVAGRAVEAEDIKATFLRALSERSVHRGSLSMIDAAQIQTPDPATVVFKLKYAYAPFASLTASGVFGWIMPREVGEGRYDPTKQAIGSGPFVFESFTPDVGFRFRKNPDWYEKGQPYLDGVQVAVVPDPAQRLAQFTANNVDSVGVPPDDLDTMRLQNPKAEVITGFDPGDGQLYFQLGDPSSPFHDIRLRQAVSLAIDREAYSKVIKQGKSTLGWYVPPRFGKWALSMEDLPADVQQWYKYDLPRARRLLQEAGGDKLAIKVLKPTPYPPDPWFQTAGEMITNMLGALPWRVQFVTIDYTKDWVGGGKGVRYGNFPADAVVWAGLEGGRTIADEYLYGFWDSRSTTSITRVNDPQIDALIDKARATLNEQESVKAYIEVQKYIASQVYCLAGIPMGMAYTMVQPQVTNYLVGDAYGIGVGTWAKLWLKQ